ncbi:hypothetical protein Tco_0869924, partial [Tanacetum coccineum]
VISSSSSSSNDNETPSFLEFYDELSDSEDSTKAQREKRGMFKCLNRYVGTITRYRSSKTQDNVKNGQARTRESEEYKKKPKIQSRSQEKSSLSQTQCPQLDLTDTIDALMIEEMIG